MSVPGILDALLILLMLAYLGYGYSVGFVRSVFGLAGIILGGVAAFFAIPLAGSWVPAPEWRLPVILIAIFALVAAGQSVGAWIGRIIRRRVEDTKLSTPDRVAGAIVNVVVAALVSSMLAFSVSSLGVPVLSQAIAGSSVLRTIDNLTPGPVKSGLAQLRSIVIQEGIPRVISAAGGPEAGNPPAIPDVATNTPALEVAARSVVKVTGNAYQCGQNQSGSGFVVAKDRVVTNAHVVAGVREPVVEVPGGGALPGRIVYFDPNDDLAVIAVNGLAAAAIPLTPTLPAGADAVFDGYPLGGPFQSQPAQVERVTTVRVNDIYGENPHATEVYQLAANVQEGNSGGPLLTTSGKVAGVVFAKAANTQNVGYALTMDELLPVAGQAAGLSAPVSSGACIRR
ncbi:MAG TPA: MarP family serine protease [Terrimesophilobacter sp.]|jgi:Trypsin-like serine proteases, typically periplasmic, contain C-terminal PDZ domain|uniref:MarP family serine protease n=1 Tax=Terrimesophilobacter sp. TaxID=2906435 RepID=UPI002F93AA2E